MTKFITPCGCHLEKGAWLSATCEHNRHWIQNDNGGLSEHIPRKLFFSMTIRANDRDTIISFVDEVLSLLHKGDTQGEFDEPDGDCIFLITEDACA